MSATREIGPRPVTAGSVLAWLVASFLLVAAFNIAMIYFAVGTFTGETEPKSYAAGLDFNKTMERAKAQRRRAWTVGGGITASAANTLSLRLAYRDENSKPIDGLDVLATFRRATNEGQDFETKLNPQGDGAYAAEVTVPHGGQWLVQVVAQRPDEPPFVLDYRTIAK